jgi:hypothetical protein
MLAYVHTRIQIHANLQTFIGIAEFKVTLLPGFSEAVRELTIMFLTKIVPDFVPMFFYFIPSS